MPFDAAIQVKNPVLVAGLAPVPAEVVQKHKDEVIQAYVQAAGRLASHRRLLVAEGLAKWRIIPYVPVRQRVRWHDYLLGSRRLAESRLQHWLTHLRIAYTDDHSQAPPAIREVAKHVQREIGRTTRRPALFAVEYFDVDPILWLNIDPREPLCQHCLGIWDYGRVVAIAG